MPLLRAEEPEGLYRFVQWLNWIEVLGITPQHFNVIIALKDYQGNYSSLLNWLFHGIVTFLTRQINIGHRYGGLSGPATEL